MPLKNIISKLFGKKQEENPLDKISRRFFEDDSYNLPESVIPDLANSSELPDHIHSRDIPNNEIRHIMGEMRTADIRGRLSKITTGKYAGWKHKVPQYPSQEEVRNAWKFIYGHLPSQTELLDHKEKHTYRMGGGYVEFPQLEKGKSMIYSGCGCTWDIDKNDNRYHKINEYTLLPVNIEDAFAPEIIKNYFNNLESSQPKK